VLWRHSNRESGLKLVQTYGLDAAKTRATALVEAIKSGKITSRNVTVGMLLRYWAYRELDAAATKSAGLLPETQELLDDVRAEEGRSVA
jgi:hypothetical protein